MRNIFPNLFRAVRPSLVIGYRLVTLNFTEGLSAFWLRREAAKPKGFRKKLLHKMAFDRRPILPLTADKIRVRDYVAERVGAEALTKLYFTARPGEPIDYSLLPPDFVAKVNHGCGGNVIVWSKADQSVEFPSNPRRNGWSSVIVHPENMDFERLDTLLRFWLSDNYSWKIGRKYPEWIYKEIDRAVLFEELLVDDAGEIPKDYKFFCFDGVVRLIDCHSSRFSRHECTIFSPDWEPLEVRYPSFPAIEPVPERPRNLERMLEIAETLSAGFDFVRVDLFDLGSQVKFGELTHYYSGGTVKFDPHSFDEVLGSYWTLPEEATR